MKSFLSFSFEKQSKRENVSCQAETANKEHPDSLYQECEHPKQEQCHFKILSIIFPLDAEDAEDKFNIFASRKVGWQITER